MIFIHFAFLLLVFLGTTGGTQTEFEVSFIKINKRSDDSINNNASLQANVTSNDDKNSTLKLKFQDSKHNKALNEANENDISSLTKLNNTDSKKQSSKTKSHNKENPKPKRIPVKNNLKIIDEKTKDFDDQGSGSGSTIIEHFLTNSKTNNAKNSTKQSSSSEKNKEKKKAKNSKDETEGEWEEQYEPGNEASDYTYGDESYGAEGGGYEYTNNNGVQSSKGYSYSLGNMNNPPIFDGQSYGMPDGGQTEMSDSGHDSSYMHPSITVNQNQEMYDPFSSMMGTSPLQNNDASSPILDDANVATEYGDYEKKTTTNRTVVTGRKRGKLHHKKMRKHIRSHMVKKARKIVTSRKHYVDGKAYKRTIMIGNRVCGSKKSTNIHNVVKKDEIHIVGKTEETSIKKEQPSAIRATDQCCAEHYECPRIVPAKSTKYGYQNDIEYDVMGCNCDAKFRNCLKNANSYTADAVGHLYFNTLKIPCLTFEQDLPEQKSELVGNSQDSMNVVSVVPDAETERETVGGAQLVVAPRNMRKDGVLDRDKQIINNKQSKKEFGDDQDTQMVRISANAKEMTSAKDDDDDDEIVDTRKNKRPDTINPNPSPSNPNPYGVKVRGIVNIPEAYLPKISINH